MKVKVFDKTGKSTAEQDFELGVDINEIDKNVLTQYVRIYTTNQRQGTSKTKTKSEVRGGGRKPWKQKGTGRARVGSIRSPLWAGGGVIHGPEPKDWSIKATKRLKQQAFAMGLAEKVDNGNIGIFEFGGDIKTKSASDLIKSLNLIDKRVLVINSKDENIYKSFRNLSNVLVQNIDEVSPYSFLFADFVLVDSNAFGLLQAKFLNK